MRTAKSPSFAQVSFSMSKSTSFYQGRASITSTSLISLLAQVSILNIDKYSYNVTDPTQAAEGLGVPHTVELGAVWGPENINGGAPASLFTTNAAIIPVVQGYWTSFIRALDPNVFRAPGSPEWAPFTSSTERILIQTNATRLETVPEDQKSRCNFLTSQAVGQFHQ